LVTAAFTLQLHDRLANLAAPSNDEPGLSLDERRLPGGSSLAKLLAEERGVRNRSALPVLTLEQILLWADAYHTKIGKFPKCPSE